MDFLQLKFSRQLNFSRPDYTDEVFYRSTALRWEASCGALRRE